MKKLSVIILLIQVLGIMGCASTQGRSGTVYQTQPVYTQSQSTQTDYNKKIIKEGLLGAATGAIAAEASGGKAGKGALIGAGTNIIGGALIDVLTTPQQQSQPQQIQYVSNVSPSNRDIPNNQRIVRKFDSNGNVISEEVYTS